MSIINISGFDELEKRLREKANLIEKIKPIVTADGDNMATNTQKRMNKKYKGHYEWVKGKGRKKVYPTGTTRRSTVCEVSKDGLTASVAPHTYYFPYLEKGTRYMKARPTLKPAFNKYSRLFKKDIKKVVEDGKPTQK